jgi:superfamily II DNA or RNA helicase
VLPSAAAWQAAEEESLARRVRRRSGATRTATRAPAQNQVQRNGRARDRDNEGIIPILARAVREVESAAERGPLRPAARVKFQAVALLAREARSAVKTDQSTTEARRASELKRLDGIGTILAKTAARDTSLLSLLAEDASVSDAVHDLKQDMLRAAGVEPEPEREQVAADQADAAPAPERRVVPQSVISRQLANPFLTPQFTAQQKKVKPRLLAGWELLGPLFKSFEYSGQRSSMALPDPTVMHTASGSDLMPHQAQVVASAQQGHRTFLLADEPGLGKTAQALLAAQAADAYPLLCVVPSVVKTNWAREVGLWTPKRRATVVQGDGENVDAFADIVIVNYEVLDRHIGWFGDFGFRGMVVDEAHFIKNKSSQRSQHVLQLSDRIRRRTPDPLLMALTGTPLINDIEDFRAIWQFLGWIDDKGPRGELMERLEDAGLTPLDPGFYPVARTCVIDMGIVRRRKVDVAKDIPARRVADLPVELDGEAGRSIREAERELARRLVARYDRAVKKRTADTGEEIGGIDRDLVRRIAAAERKASSETKTGDNVFSMLRRIGQAKAAPAADYSAQLARSVGKVVFFAKHVDVMDAAEEIFEKRGLGHVSIRGDQTRAARQKAIDDFTNDPDVAVAVCSLMAAGVGVNLQAASNVVLAELSWTDAEQTQAIDRVHRIGQELPVTAWRIIAAQTLDTKIAELIDSKAGLAARALEGSDEELPDSADIQMEALVGLLTDALEARTA